MLANGATLAYSADGVTYTTIPGLKEIPEIPLKTYEWVDNTTLGDTYKEYEPGIGDLGDLTYKFKHDNSGAATATRVLTGLADGSTVYYWKETDSEGTTYVLQAYANLSIGGGGVNGAIEDTLTLRLADGAITVTDPA